LYYFRANKNDQTKYCMISRSKTRLVRWLHWCRLQGPLTWVLYETQGNQVMTPQ
jgi:hypothetical protein